MSEAAPEDRAAVAAASELRAELGLPSDTPLALDLLQLVERRLGVPVW